jgi:hypothetical protein
MSRYHRENPDQPIQHDWLEGVEHVSVDKAAGNDRPTEIDYSCRVCGKPCNVAPNPPGRAVCEDHCEDHYFQYDPWRRTKVCLHCDKEISEDFYDRD